MEQPLTIALFPGVPRYRVRDVLDGVEYLLVLRWSQRETKWYLDLSNANGDLLVAAIKVVVNWPLLADVRGSGLALPAGELVAMDTRSTPADPGLDELGDSIPLLYFSADFVAEVNAELDAA